MGKTLNVAFTAPVNPSSASPTISSTQLWKGLQRKIRHAEEFVKPITSCTVLKDDTDGDDGVVEREATFASGEKIKETVTSVAGLKIEFLRPGDGGLVTNSIAEDEKGEMWLTYSFQLPCEHERGSKEWEEMRKKVLQDAVGAVKGSIDTVREMVKEGKL